MIYKTWQTEEQRKQFCYKCVESETRPHAFPCFRCTVNAETGLASHFEPAQPEEEKVTYTYNDGLTFRKDKNGVTVSGMRFDTLERDFWEDFDELRNKLKDTKGQMNMKKLNDYFTAEEIKDLKENPLLIDKILDQITNPLYERRKAEVKEVEKQQIVKAAEKYPEPLNPDSWTPEQLVNHGLQEVHDLTNYLTALLIKSEDMAKEYQHVCDKSRHLEKITEKIKTEARYWKVNYKNSLLEIEELEEALDKAGDELARQALKINQQQLQRPNPLAKGAVAANFNLQAECKLLREKNNNLHEEMKKLKKKNDEWQEKWMLASYDSDMFKGQRDQLQQRNDNQAESIEQLMQEKEKIEKDFITLEGSYERLLEDHENEVDAGKQRLEKMEEKAANFEKAYEELEKKFSEYYNANCLHKNTITQQEMRIKRLESEKEDLAKRLANATVKISDNNSDDLDTQFNMRIKQRTIDEQRLEIKKITRWHDEAVAANKGLGERIEELERKLVNANKSNHFDRERVITLTVLNAELEAENKALRNEHICEKNQVIQYEMVKTGRFFGTEVKRMPVAVKCDICNATLWSRDNA